MKTVLCDLTRYSVRFSVSKQLQTSGNKMHFTLFFLFLSQSVSILGIQPGYNFDVVNSPKGTAVEDLLQFKAKFL